MPEQKHPCPVLKIRRIRILKGCENVYGSQGKGEILHTLISLKPRSRDVRASLTIRKLLAKHTAP